MNIMNVWTSVGSYKENERFIVWPFIYFRGLTILSIFWLKIEQLKKAKIGYNFILTWK